MADNREMEVRCASCGAVMNCNPEGDCWCKELPLGPMPVAGELMKGCLCRVCLERRLREDRVEGRRAE
jgi:hypothetical protein